jgi:hypothetical protein
MKLRLCLIVVLFFPFAFSHAAEFCVESVDVEKAYQQDFSKAVSKEEKSKIKKLFDDEKKLVREFLAQLQLAIDAQELDLIARTCVVINHGPFYSNELLVYSAETDPYFSPRDQTLFSKKSPNSTIRLNVTEKFIKLLQFAKENRGEKALMQPQVLGYAGSLIVRMVHIAEAYQKKGRRDLRNSLMKGKDVVLDETMKIVSDHQDKVLIERSALEIQNQYIGSFSDDGVLNWALEVSKIHPEFFVEKTIRFNLENGIFEEIDPIFFDGQFRPGEIVREMYVQNNAFKNPSGISQENIEFAKQKVNQLKSEWNRYINSSDNSKLLQQFVMLGVLEPFIQRYNEELTRAPEIFK